MTSSGTPTNLLTTFKVTRHNSTLLKRPCKDLKSATDTNSKALVLVTDDIASNKRQRQSLNGLSMREETKFRVDSKDKDEKMPRAHVNSRRRTIASVKAVPMEQSATLLNFYPILPKKALDALKDDEQIIKPLNEFSVDMHHQNKENKLLLANGCATTAAGDLSSEKHSLEPELTAAEKARKLLQKPLALPKKYDRIFNAFQALESVYILHKGRGQENELEFHKIAKSVRNIISSDFDLHTLRQLVYLVPDLYTFYPAQHTDSNKGTVYHSFRLAWPSLTAGDCDITHSTATIMKESKVRKERLRVALLNLVVEQYKIKCSSGPCPPTEWNPSFDLKGVPDVPEAQLEIFNLYLKPVLSNVAPVTAEKPRATFDSSTLSTPTPAKDSGLSLLERIRLKQKLRETNQAVKPNKEVLMQRAMLSRLTQIADVLDVYCLSTKKSAIYMKDAIKKIVKSSSTPISEIEARECLEQLSSRVPEWCVIKQSEFGTLITLDDGSDMRVIRQKLRNLCSI